jgi:thymidylate synthase
MNRQTFHEAYRGLLVNTLNQGFEEVNERTKSRIKVVPGGHAFTLDLREGTIPMAGNRRYYPHIAAAETAWQFMGTKDPKFILSKAPKLWSKFVEDGELKTAYGWRWREAFERDQIGRAVSQLKANPTNRQLFVSAWDPRCDGLGGVQPKNIPCPLGFAINRFDDDLHMSVYVRSSDLFVGLPYDVMAYALTLDAIAASTDCKPGSLHFSLAHAHLYETHWNATKACLDMDLRPKDAREREMLKGASSHWATGVQPNLPGWSIEMILGDPEAYCDTVKRLAKRAASNSWDPMPEVVE